MTAKIPVLLLKTKSPAGDAYEELFRSVNDNGLSFEPEFVPVLEHRFEEEGMAKVRSLLRNKSIGLSSHCKYGGFIFTSQRAVEAFSELVEEGKARGEEDWPHLQDVPFYSVGPATTRALKAVSQVPPLQVFGEHTGIGEKLAPFILEHYSEWYKDRATKPPLLFLVGDKRRDIIPKVLTAAGWQLDEVVIYGTGEMKSFQDDFRERLLATADCPQRWVVVYSPSGCDSMLKALDLIDAATGRAKPNHRDAQTYIATIGPTTRDHLIDNFGYEPEVCAEQPSPEGVWDGIAKFSRAQRSRDDQNQK